MFQLRLFLSFIFFCLADSAIAHDEQLTLFSVAAPSNVFSPGAGLEVGTTVGNRTVLGAAMEYTGFKADNRDLRLRLDGRLLYSSELDTHWYPQTSVQWQLQENTLSPWFGAGFQRQLSGQMGVTGEVLVSPGDWDVQLRLGLRVWLMRFRSLDARVKQSDPMGAVYTGGGRSSTRLVSIEQEESGTTSGSTQGVSAEEDKAPVAYSVVETVSVQTVSAQTVSKLPTDSWYVNLGVFKLPESMQPLKEDVRLVSYQTKLTKWLDSEKMVYRLLVGPYDKVQAQTVSNQLTASGLENFLFQKP